MAIPDFQTLMRPTLSLLSDGTLLSNCQVIDSLSDQFELTDEERSALLPSGTQRTIDNRVQWALSHLFQAGLIQRPQRGHVQITDQGRSVLQDHPDRVDMGVLQTYESYRAFRERSRIRKTSTATGDALGSRAVEAASPQDLLAAAIAENRAAVEGDVL